MTQNYFRDFSKYTLFNVIGMIGLSCYILADTFFVSQGLGTDGLAALNLSIPIYNFIHGSGLMLGMGGGIQYAIQKTQNDHVAANRTFANTIYLLILLSAIFVLTGIFFSGNIVSLFGAKQNVFSMSKTYLQVILFFSPAFLMNNVLLCFVRNDGSPQLSMAAMITGSLSNIVLDWIFIFPFQMGIFGAAFATGLAPVISMAVLSIHFIRKKNAFHFNLSRPNLRRLLDILSGGLPSLVTEVSSGIVIILFNSILLNLSGNIGVAAYSIIANISLVIVAIYTGIAQGTQPIVSHHYGIGNNTGIRAVFKYALASMLLLSIIIYSILFICSPQIIALFNSEQNLLLQDIATEAMRLYFIACPFVGFNVILSGFFTATEHTKPAQIISLLRGFFLIIPITFILSYLFNMIGTWCAFPVTEGITAVISLIFLFLIKRSKNKMF